MSWAIRSPFFTAMERTGAYIFPCSSQHQHIRDLEHSLGLCEHVSNTFKFFFAKIKKHDTNVASVIFIDDPS